MIRSLELASAPCFGEKAVSVGPLTGVNFFFGANGAGKTTISRALADLTHCPGSWLDWDPGQLELGVRVYNRDYVSRTIRGAGALPGVFLLGEGSVEAQEEIDELTGPLGKIPAAQKKLKEHTTSLGSAQPARGRLGDIAMARSALASAAWEAKKAFPDDLQSVFGGYNSSVDKLVTRVLEVARQHTSTTDSEEALLEEAASIFDTTATEVDLLPTMTAQDPALLPGSDLLGRRIVGSTGGSLAELIDTLDNSHWVDEGRQYLDHTGGRCPFCQQESPEGLAVQLGHYFDAAFEEQTAALGDFVARYRAMTASLVSRLNQVVEHSAGSLTEDAFARARATLEAALVSNDAELKKKVASPAGAVTIEPLSEHIAAVNDVIEAANERTKTHNERVRNRRSRVEPLTQRCWRYFVRHVLRDQVTTYETSIRGLEKAKANLENKIAQTSETLRELRARQTELQKLVRSSRRVIEDINTMLTSVGFTSFRLADSPNLTDGYSLTRSNGVPVDDFLSEGERTFLTFLYFFHQLRHSPEDAALATQLVAVIDDPISSLDSDILFVVSTLTRDIIDKARRDEGNVRQVIVLTHNVQYHKEVTYLPPREDRPERSYFMLRKTTEGSTVFTAHRKNPVMAPYEALWADVRAAENGTLISVAGLENILRRIVEYYFRTMGGMDDHEIIAKLDPAERIAGRSLFSWMNGGSHTIADPLDFSPSGIEAATYLSVFERIFSVSGHHGHFLMMMQRRESPDAAGAEPARIASPMS